MILLLCFILFCPCREAEEECQWIIDAIVTCYKTGKALKKQASVLARQGKKLDIFQEQRLKVS